MQKIGEFPRIVTDVQNPFNDNRLRRESDAEKAIQDKIKRIWDGLEVDEFGPVPAIEDVSRYEWSKKPVVLGRYLHDFTLEDYQELLDVLWAKNRADETRLANLSRPWDVHVQRIYFSVMPSNDGPRFDETLSPLARKRVQTFLDAVRGLADGKEVADAELFPFDNRYFIERKFPKQILERIAKTIQDDLESMSVPEDVKRRPTAGHILRHYRAITSVNDTTYRFHDEPGLMAISVYRKRTNQFNDVLYQLKLLAAGQNVPGLDRDKDYPGYAKEDFDDLRAMLENEKLLLLDMSKKHPPSVDVGNDLSDVEEDAVKAE